MSAYRRAVAGLTVIVAIAVVIAIVLVTQGSSGSNASADTNSGRSSGSASVQRRNLVATDTESGTLSYANPQTVYDRLTGTITWLPAVGQLIQPGQVLFDVDNEPVILMNGSTPAYRALGPADSNGPDVLELNRSLIALGYNPDGIVADDVWQSATTAGVDQFQASLGETQTGTLALGRVVFLPGPQLVGTVSATVGSTGGGGGSGSPTGASLHARPPAPEFVDLVKPGAGRATLGPATTTPGTATTSPTNTSTTGAKTPTSTPTHPSTRPSTQTSSRSRGGPSGPSTLTIEQQIQQIIQALRAEAAASKPSQPPSSSRPGSNASSPAASSSSHPSSSSTAPAVAVLTTTSDKLIVTVDLPASSQSEARVGGRVQVELPDGSAARGRIIAVSPVAQSSSSSSGSGSGGGGGGGNGNGGGSSAAVPVTIAFTHRISGRGLDQAAVSVLFAQARATNVLSVPVTALIATSGSTYALQQAQAPHRLIPVTTGLFAAGYVQVSGAGIYDGLQVTDSQG